MRQTADALHLSTTDTLFDLGLTESDAVVVLERSWGNAYGFFLYQLATGERSTYRWWHFITYRTVR